MNRLFLTTAALAITVGFDVASASAASIVQPAPGTIVYGELPAAPPVGAMPPSAPAGFHYEWVYGYDHHAVYKAHWEPVRNS